MDKEQLSTILYSTSTFLSLPFETQYISGPWQEFSKRNVILPVLLVVFYLCFVGVGGTLMTTQQPYNLTMPLAIWNAILCAFCFVGMCRTVSIFCDYS